MPMQTSRALHGWRRYGKRSFAPRATRKTTIWSGSRWYSRYSGCSRKRRGSCFTLLNPDNFTLGHKGIRSGDAQEKSFKKAQSEKGSQSATRWRRQEVGDKKARGEEQARREESQKRRQNSYKEGCQESRQENSEEGRRESEEGAE